MSLLLNGAKTATIAGTEMQCIEIYTGESYTLPFHFQNSTGGNIDISSWTLTTAAKWYTCNIAYPIQSAVEDIVISNLVLDAPQPGAPAGLTAAKTGGGTTGDGYIFLPTTLSGGTGSPPSPTPLVSDSSSVLCIVTLTVVRTDTVSGLVDTNREPIGVIIRYQ